MRSIVLTGSLLSLISATGLLPVRSHGALPIEGPPSTPEQQAMAVLNLKEVFRQVIDDNALIERYQQQHERVEDGKDPAPVTPHVSRHRAPDGVQVIEPATDPATVSYRTSISEETPIPLRGFQAPILDEANEWRPLLEEARQSNEGDRAAADLINRRLAYDGLLSTLAETLDVLGPSAYATDPAEGLLHLNALGFPTDLLACFARDQRDNPSESAREVLALVARRLRATGAVAALQPELDSLPFRFPAAWSKFAAAPENGIDELGMLRLQAGGGYSHGIVPGECIDVIGQLVKAFPNLDYVVSTPAEVLKPLQSWVRQTLPLERTHQFKMIDEPYRVKTWAQDNGKAGTTVEIGTGRSVYSVLTPRFASRCDGFSSFLPTESFLMDGLEAAGLRVVHCPLLFQGGNVMPILDPRTGNRVLLVGEGAMERNVALGLNREQTIAALRKSFGVDHSLIVPAVSFHLDFDVNVRAIDGQLVAFVNDPQAAARIIVGLGIDTFQRHGAFDQEEAGTLHQDLTGSAARTAILRLRELVRTKIGPDGRIDASLSSWFRSSRAESATGNLQVFLQALDLVEWAATDADDSPRDQERKAYFQALQRMDQARLSQMDVLRSYGFKLVKVPSMPHMYRSINYLNGIQHKDGYIMPAFGGFYTALDDAAERAFQKHMEPGTEIRRIRCAELQRKSGAIHCATSAFPLLSTNSPYQASTPRPLPSDLKTF